MEKILTISIAAYNVSQYIEQTLDSLVNSKYLDGLEIFIVDDGGNDSTMEIAELYKEKFPKSVNLVYKKNGGYGSTVNYSLSHATGKFFKLLDGDDWVQTEEFDKFVQELYDVNSDLVITPYFRGTEADYDIISHDEINVIGEEILLASLAKYPPLGMWSMTYKTSILRDSKLLLPEHTFYTDQYYCTIPMPFVKKIIYFNYPVYFYRLGRDGQSVSKESRIKNELMTLNIAKDLIEYTEKNKSHSNYPYLLNRVGSYYMSALKTILLSPFNRKQLNRFKEFDLFVKNCSPILYKSVKDKGKLGKLIFISRKTQYYLLYLLKLVKPNGVNNWK